jgi:hypothetical protein
MIEIDCVSWALALHRKSVLLFLRVYTWSALAFLVPCSLGINHTAEAVGLGRFLL